MHDCFKTDTPPNRRIAACCYSCASGVFNIKCGWYCGCYCTKYDSEISDTSICDEYVRRNMNGGKRV
jgi:hypothetical protein